MRVVILGSAAGGGVPQWNCGCQNCEEARRSGTRRTQSSVAVSADGARWVLLNASPDLRAQVATHPELWPRGARTTPIAAVVCTDGELDHTLGLLLMREATAALPVYVPAGVAALLEGDWPLPRILAAYAGVELRVLPDRQPVALADGSGTAFGLACTAVPVARRPPRYARAAPAGTYDVGLRLRDERTGGTLAYIPTAGAVDEAVRLVATGADLLLFDGTFWSDGELRAAGAAGAAGGAAPSARELGHLPVGGPGGSLDSLRGVGARRTVLVHINNTNPILAPTSAERRAVAAAGLEVAADGMAFEL
jgi:pyrroloquinoline quinone biosynthesis protein B